MAGLLAAAQHIKTLTIDMFIQNVKTPSPIQTKPSNTNIPEILSSVLKIKKKLKTITKQEESKNEKIIKLEKIVNDMSNGIVSRMKAKNELAQIRSKDTLPLMRDKINQQAALRKIKNINKITNISNKKGKELNHPPHLKKNVEKNTEIKNNIINNNLNRSNSINEILSKSEDILKSIEEEGLLN